MHFLDKSPGRTAKAGGREYLFFSGYNYLGVSDVPAFVQLLQEGMQKYGWLFPSSRISNTRLKLYEEAEALFSEITGVEESVLFSSGFVAGRSALSLLEGEIMSAPDSHPAILHETSFGADRAQWTSFVTDYANSSPTPISITSDSVNPLKPGIYDFGFLQKIRRQVTVLIDDSHGIGVTGKDGAGTASLVPSDTPARLLFSYSLSKAFGIAGGVAGGTKEFAEQLRNTSGYCAATPPLPAQMYAFLRGQEIYSEQRQKLYENVRFFSECIRGIPGILFDFPFPVFVLPPWADAALLQDQGVLISSFAYPDPRGPKLNRIVVNALHVPSDLEYAAESLWKLFKNAN